MVSRMEEYGWKPMVLTVTDAAVVRSGGLQDPLEGKVGAVLRVVDPLAAVQKSGGIITAPSSDGQGGLKARLVAIAKTFLFPDRTIFWAWKLRGASHAIQKMAPDIIISTSPSLASHFAARRLARKCGAKWIAEFRDPASWLPKHDGTSQFKRNLLKNMERSIVESADAIITVSDAFSKYFRSQYPAAPIYTVPNGSNFDEAMIARNVAARKKRMAEQSSDSPLILVHAGALYGGARDPAPLIAAAQVAAKQIERRILLRFIGDDSYLAADAAKKLGAEHLVEAIGALGHAETVAETEQADALLALLHNDPVARISIMSKFFDYVATANPVLVVGERQAMLSRIVEDDRAGTVREYSDIEGMAAWIAELAEKPETFSYDPLPICKKWSADEMAKKMAALLNSLVV